MELIVKYIPELVFDASQVPNVLDKYAVDWHQLWCHNWAKDFPYQPDVRFRIAHTGRQILLQYDVRENSIRAVADTDNGRVWEDSCCEFFVSPSNDGIYYNFECNCIGTLLIGAKKDTNERHRASEDVLSSVKRWTSLPHQSFPLQKGDAHWQLTLIIPDSAFFLHHINYLSQREMRCNLYKCGDLLAKPHYMSWNPVHSEKPNFHRPQDFDTCIFE